MKFTFELPILSPGDSAPTWTGDAFKIGDRLTKLLEYNSDLSGWSDGLTSFHEDTAGDNHFIDRASREHALQQIQKYASGDFPTILEIGCSSGFLIKDICKKFPEANIIGADVVRDALLKLADEMPYVPFLRFDLVNCPLPDNSVDVVVMLNVLEHIEHDEAAIKQVYRILKPGGALILEVPAGPHLYDAYDKVLMHYRRYSSQILNTLAHKAGFEVKKQSHLGFFLYPGFAFVKKRNQRLLSESVALQQQRVEKNIRHTGGSSMLSALMQFELWMGRWVSYSAGIRCLMSCVKPSE